MKAEWQNAKRIVIKIGSSLLIDEGGPFAWINGCHR